MHVRAEQHAVHSTGYTKVIRLQGDTHTQSEGLLLGMESGVESDMLQYLICPGSSAEHFCALEARSHAAGHELSSIREQSHIDTLTKINQSQPMLQVLLTQVLVLQEPGRQRGRESTLFGLTILVRTLIT